MFVAFSMIGTICWSCWADQDPVRPRGRPVDVQVEQAIPDGCARFQIHANPAQTVTIDSIYGTQYCQTDELKLIQDSAAVFDAVTGKLRVPLVVKNVGTQAVRGLLKVRYDADSVQLFDANGNPVAGPTNILGLGDSTLNNGRVAYWGYLPILQPAGQLQVLFAGQTSRRRWLELQGTDWNRTVKIKLFTTARYDTVPAVAPTSMPNNLRDSSNVDWTPSGGEPPFVRDHLYVLFTHSASQSTRQSAISAIGGVVVGGGLGGDAYMVRIGPDPTGQKLTQAIVLMRSQPGVVKVAKEYYLAVRPSWRKPTDGVGWRPLNWHVDAVGPSDTTWALEYLNVPRAWGCETGDPTLRVGVLDVGFSLAQMSDLALNVVDTTHVNIPGVPAPHGGWVASILAARGNNNSGVTGAVWKAHLDLRDVTLLDSVTKAPKQTPDTTGLWRAEFLEHFRGAVQNGDKIINISLGADSLPVFSLSDQKRDSVFRDLISWLLLQADASNPSGPVFVISAGNVPNGDPRESVYPLFLDSLPKRSIVVRAADRNAQLVRSLRSGGSAYVTFAAPGKSVAALDVSGATTLLTGSSMASPLVAGVAALVRSFAPTLPADSVKYYLELGASLGGKTIAGIPVPDAYATLKALASRRTGAVCGNRVFIKNDSSLTVERKLDDVTSDDEIGTWSTGWPVMFVEHGGKSISNGLVSGSNVNFVLGANGWTSQSGGGVPSNSPFLRSHEGVTHDGDTTLYSFPIPTVNPTQVELYLGDSLGVPLRPKVTVPLAGANGAYVRALDLSRPRAFFAAQGTTSSTLYAIDFVNSTSALVPLSYTLDRVDWLGVAEDGAELRVVNRVVNGTTCNIDFVSLRTADYGTRRRRVTGSKGANGSCAVDGAIAPRIATFGAPQGTTPFVAPPPPRRPPRLVIKGPTLP